MFNGRLGGTKQAILIIACGKSTNRVGAGIWGGIVGCKYAYALPRAVGTHIAFDGAAHQVELSARLHNDLAAISAHGKGSIVEGKRFASWYDNGSDDGFVKCVPCFVTICIGRYNSIAAHAAYGIGTRKTWCIPQLAAGNSNAIGGYTTATIAHQDGIGSASTDI